LLEFLSAYLPWIGASWSFWTAAWLATIGAVGLAYGASLTVDAAVQMAERWGISPRIVGLTIVAIGTSAPEFAVTITAALEGSHDMAISNVVGSNIFNLGFILGGIALIRPVATTGQAVWVDGSVLFLSAVAVWVLFGIDLGVERSNGAILLLGLLAYLGASIWGTQKPHHAQAESPGGESPARKLPMVRLLAGIALIAVAAEVMVEAASEIATSFGVSEWVIGVTIVAAGTSLPELVTSLVAVLKNQPGLGLGNIVGSDIFNVLGVLGLTAVIQPVTIRPEASGSLLALAVMIMLTIVFMRSGWRISRLEGGFLVLLGICRWLMDFS